MSTGFTRQHIDPLPAFSDILRDNESFAVNDEEGIGNSINTWFDDLMIQSGVGIGPSLMLTLCLFSGVVLGGVVLVTLENPLSAAVSGVVGAIAPLVVVTGLRQRRRKQMMDQLPAMIDELARAAKTGRSIEQCWELVAADTPAPLGNELTDCSHRMRMGEDMPNALRELPRRTGIITLNILVTALSVHQQTGGDLISVLERLSETIRDRLLFLGKLRAATVGSRWTSILMLVLPPLIIIFFSFQDPTYLPRLMASDMGRTATIGGVVCELIGTLLILRILQSSQRS
jgi:tight adherence protein B